MFRSENNPDISDHFQRTISILALITIFLAVYGTFELVLLGVHQSLRTPFGLSLGPHG